MKNRGGILYSLFFCKEKITTSENTTLAVIKVYIKLKKLENSAIIWAGERWVRKMSKKMKTSSNSTNSTNPY